MSGEAAVLEFISQNFKPEAITVKDYALLPFGKLVSDQQGGEMLVYFDILTEKVKYAFPEK